MIYVLAKVTRANGANIDDTDIVTPVNLTLHSIFSEMELKLNDTLVSSLDSTYAYRAYLETILSFGHESKNSQLACSMYYKDTAAHMDNAAVADAAATNTGLLKRRQFFSGSKTVDMMGSIHADLASQERLIPSDVGIKIKLQRNKDAFCLMSPTAASTYKLQILECKMFVRKVRISNSVYIAHAEQLQVQNAKFPINRVICKTFTVSQGNLNFVQESLFSGQMPTRLIIGFVENDSFNGAYDKNPSILKTMTWHI